MSGKQAKRLRSLAREIAGMKHADKVTLLYNRLKREQVRVTSKGIKLRPQ